MAKSFRFSLETVRRLRKQACDRQMREVANAVSEVTAAESAQALLGCSLADNLGQTRLAQGQKALDVAMIRTAYAHQGWLAGKLDGVVLELEQRRSRLEAERKKLGDASAKVKAIEKLRERQWRRHLAQLEREDRLVNDEVASRICSRQARGGDANVKGISGAA